MVHTFKFKDKYYAYDVESGSFFSCSRLTYAILTSNENEIKLSGCTDKDREDAESEIKRLTADGFLYANPPQIPSVFSNGDIKSLCLHICHDCNLKCSYCFGDGGTYCGEREYMSIDTVKAAINFLIIKSGGRKNLEMDFFGGEPLMNLDTVKEGVKYARQREKECGKSFKFTLTTNGVLLNDETIEFLNKEMDNVVISIDGRKEIHDGIRKTVNGKGSYDLILKNALKFRKARKNGNYYIRGTFTADNCDFSKDVLHINDCGFDQISVEPVVLEKDKPLAITEKHLPKIKEEYEKLASEYIERRKTDKWFNFFHFMVDLNNGTCLKKRLTGCGAGDEYLAVAPSGELYPCHQFVGMKEYALGNVFDGQLSKELTGIFRSSNLLTKPDCKECFAKYFCSGGCSANNIKFAGDINKPYKITCEMMRKRFECALAVYCEEHGDKETEE